MAAKIKAYVDSSAFIAFLDGSDSFHDFFVERFSGSANLFTSAAVIIETHAWFLKRYDARKAFQFLSFIEELKILKILAVGPSDLNAAKVYLKKYLDQQLSLVDALGLYFMEQHRESECWSTDRHLGLTGRRLVVYT